jgi:hypothetical protein
LYGAPDTQTANSATWSFADGGGITASDPSGNHFRATVYSKDGKPKDQETAASGVQPQAVQSATISAGTSVTPVTSEYLSAAELEGATQGSGKGVTITAGSTMDQAFAASLANVNLAQYASIQLFTTESWVAFRSHLAHQQYQQFDPATLSQEETLRGLAKNTSPELLKINLRVLGVNKHGDMALHVDTLEMSSARQRGTFAKQAAEELHCKEGVISHDLSQMWMKLEMLRDEQIARALAPKEPVDKMTEPEREAALALLRDPRLMERIVEDFALCVGVLSYVFYIG